MTPAIIQALLRWSEDRPNYKAEQPANDEEIRAAEARLGFAFPEDYKWFLRSYGGGQMGPLSIIGLHWSEVMCIYDKDIFTARDFYFKPWMDGPNRYVFSQDGMGNIWLADESGDIYFADHEEKAVTLRYRSFSEWMEAELLSPP